MLKFFTILVILILIMLIVLISVIIVALVSDFKEDKASGKVGRLRDSSRMRVRRRRR